MKIFGMPKQDSNFGVASCLVDHPFGWSFRQSSWSGLACALVPGCGCSGRLVFREAAGFESGDEPGAGVSAEFEGEVGDVAAGEEEAGD